MSKKHFKTWVLLMDMFLMILILPTHAQPPKLSMTYLYAGTTSLYINNIDRSNRAFTVVCPDYFEIYSTGDLKLLPKIDGDFVDAMHDRGIKVTPFLSNHWNETLGRAALNNRNTLVTQIISAISQYGFDGVNIDIENLTDTDRSQYTDFIRLLKEKLPEGKIVSIAVAANPYGVYYGWAGSYDYKALGQLCDSVMIMAYDEHYYGSVEGPVASSTFVENSLKYALKVIPKEKIVLGLPFYGRYWKQGAIKGGSGITSYDVDTLVGRYESQVSYNPATQTARAVVTIRPEDPKPVVWGGNVLNAGTYTIYYDNEQSLKFKLNLIQKYGILGAGSWALGQESLKTWEYYERWLNGQYFSDILGHYAQDDILSMAQKGWMIGVSSSNFAPDRTLTRAEAAIIMVRALGLDKETPDEPFIDTTDHYARDMIGIAKKYQIFFGDGSNRFWPNSSLTREEMALVLDRVLVLPNPVTDNPFSDVDPIRQAQSYGAIMRLAANGIARGNSQGLFNPYASVHRGEMASFINRASAYEMTNPAIVNPDSSAPENITEPR